MTAMSTIAYFNSHAHVERDYLFQNAASVFEDFNSHAHVERDLTKIITISSRSISTHTLTWSVTIYSRVLNNFIIISTHTLTWSVTKDFLRYAIGKIISTHTLTWSVT